MPEKPIERHLLNETVLNRETWAFYGVTSEIEADPIEIEETEAELLDLPSLLLEIEKSHPGSQALAETIDLSFIED